MAPAPDPQ